MSNRPAFRVAVTLVEITLGLAIAAIVVFASIRAYYYSRENALYQQTVEMIGTVRGAIGARYGMTSDYSTVAPNKIIVSLPQSIVNPAGTSLVTPFRGDASVGPDTAARLGDSFYISLNNLPSDACSRLTRSDFGRDAIAMRIDASNAIGPVNATNPLPLSSADQQTAAATCANTKLTSVSIQFGLSGVSASSGSSGGGSNGGGAVSAADLAAAMANPALAPSLGFMGLNLITAATQGNPSDMDNAIMNTYFDVANKLGQPWPLSKAQFDLDYAISTKLIDQYVAAGSYGVDPNPTAAAAMKQQLDAEMTQLAAALKGAGVAGF